MKNIFYLFLLCVLVTAGCTTTGGNTSDNPIVKSGNRVLEVRAGSPVDVELAARLSTGFSWKLVYPLPEGIILAAENVRTSGKDKTGAEDIQVFRIKARPGEYTLTFRYGEHWKSKPEFIDTCTVTIIAK
ncbi:MAG TPA: protease inhibitor I42 family protein [Spirochaetota bacterium]|nr:protease inhibitor I42 family protein [Spirochaetota bacterium]HQO39860.1 protease inhibitor I42 family protein [Spirochaetota bacterium]